MPKQSNSLKQRNKAFKGSSKRKAEKKAAKNLKKKIVKTQAAKGHSKVKGPQIKTEKTPQLIQNQGVERKQVKKPQIIALVPLNAEASPQAIKQLLLNHFEMIAPIVNSYSTQDVFLNIPANNKLIKTPLQFICPLDRSLETILDACKVADLICPLLDCQNCDVSQISTDPLQHAHAYDQLGYKLLSNLRAQGLPPQVCIIQGLQNIKDAKRGQVKKLFTRFFESEFPDTHVVSLESQDMSVLLRTVQQINPVDLEWRTQRGYMLPEDITFSNNQLQITGVWRGKLGLSPNQLIHITGLEDFQMQRIELIRRDMEECYEADAPESLDPVCRSKKDQDIGDELLKDLENLGIAEEEQDIEMGDQESDVSYDGIEIDTEQKPEQYEIIPRAPEDLDYEDEVEYGMETKLRERYARYQAIRNLRASEFDPLTFLPEEAEKIYNFRYLKKIKQDVVDEHVKNQKVAPNFRVRITLSGITQDQVKILTVPNRICVVSGVLQFERKLTQMHVKIHKHPFCDKVFKSKQPVFLQVGFRRATVNPIYSRILTNCNKTKFVREFKDQGFYLASFYYFACFPPQQVIFWSNEFEYRAGEILATGEIARCDQFQVILKRIMLTGYPLKINKRKAVVRMMFFNPEDVRYFRPVELSTKNGLRGNIIEPLGTHGLMKCIFNNYIRPNDVISLALYKRVHPRFPKLL